MEHCKIDKALDNLAITAKRINQAKLMKRVNEIANNLKCKEQC